MFEKEIKWVIGAFALAIIGVTLIVALFQEVQSLIPQVPSYIAVVIVGILGIFIYAVRDKIKKSIRV